MNSLEKRVRDVAAVLHAEQVCRLYQISNDIKIAGDKLIHGAQVPGDFWGYTAGGRAILIECKMTSQPRLAIGTKAGLRPHQLAALFEIEKAGGLGLVVWQYQTQVAVIRSGLIRVLSKDRRSISWASCPHHQDVMTPSLRFFRYHFHGAVSPRS
jgi:hypothetical protein